MIIKKLLKFAKGLIFAGLFFLVGSYGLVGIIGTIQFFGGNYDGRPWTGVLILLIYVTTILSVTFCHVFKHFITKH
jgi:hypothetical protein